MMQLSTRGLFGWKKIDINHGTVSKIHNLSRFLGYLVMRKNGTVHYSDFGEFNCGTVDLTHPDAFNWYKNIIKTNLIEVGFRGEKFNKSIVVGKYSRFPSVNTSSGLSVSRIPGYTRALHEDFEHRFSLTCKTALTEHRRSSGPLLIPHKCRLT